MSSSSVESKTDSVGELTALAQRSRAAAQVLAASPHDKRVAALNEVRRMLEERKEELLAANEEDKKTAREMGVSEQLFKRLEMGGSKYDALLSGVSDVASLADPCGRVSLERELADGLRMWRVSCPIGVLCVIFEARPDAAVQIASLAVMSCNAVILKGGKEAAQSNAAIVSIFQSALRSAGLPADAVQLVSTRDEVRELLSMDTLIDLVIPRGSNALVRHIQASTRIPVLGHADGICSVYVDSAADGAKAAKLVADSKAQYPAACNAAELCMVHSDVLSSHLPLIAEALEARGVKLLVDERAAEVLPGREAATEEQFHTEFLSLTIAIKTVDSMDEAVAHINAHGSHHTDAIITEDAAAATSFLRTVDSAGVYHNASTRFADGFRYGFGAEVGVSTNRVHARGPVGVDGLLIYKYIVRGDGHVVEPFASGDAKFTHRDVPAESSTAWLPTE